MAPARLSHIQEVELARRSRQSSPPFTMSVRLSCVIPLKLLPDPGLTLRCCTDTSPTTTTPTPTPTPPHPTPRHFHINRHNQRRDFFRADSPVGPGGGDLSGRRGGCLPLRVPPGGHMTVTLPSREGRVGGAGEEKLVGNGRRVTKCRKKNAVWTAASTQTAASPLPHLPFHWLHTSPIAGHQPEGRLHDSSSLFSPLVTLKSSPRYAS